jgi:hypothetical protein
MTQELTISRLKELATQALIKQQEIIDTHEKLGEDDNWEQYNTTVDGCDDGKAQGYRNALQALVSVLDGDEDNLLKNVHPLTYGKYGE